jgi:hypothetical protein
VLQPPEIFQTLAYFLAIGNLAAKSFNLTWVIRANKLGERNFSFPGGKDEKP